MKLSGCPAEKFQVEVLEVSTKYRFLKSLAKLALTTSAYYQQIFVSL